MRLAAWLAMLAAVCAHAQGPREYAHGLSVVTPPGAAYVRLAIPPAVYEGSAHRDLSDMRIFNADGEVVPFAFVPAQAEPPQPLVVPLRMFPLHVSGDRRDVDGLALTVVRNARGTTIDVTSRDADAGQAHVLAGYVLDVSESEDPLVALTFAMPAASSATSMTMRVDASDDLVHWRTIRHDATLVLLDHAGRRLVRDRVELPATRTKYVRLSWSPGRPSIEFTGVNGEFGTKANEPAREWRTVAGSAVPDREGEFQYDLGGAFPVDRLAVDLAVPNTILPTTILARDDAKMPWQPVATTVFYRIAPPAGGVQAVTTTATEVTSPPLAVDGRARRYWMLRVDPRAGLGPTPPTLRAGWQPQEIVFTARGRGPFVLAYGKYQSTAGALPIETLIPDFASTRALPAHVALARAGASVDLGGAVKLEKPSDTKRWLLWAALIAGALVLAWMAVRLSRDIEARENAGPAPSRPRDLAATTKTPGEDRTGDRL